MAQWLGALNALQEDSGSILSTYMTTVHNHLQLQFQVIWPLQAPGMHKIHRHTHAGKTTHTHKIEICLHLILKMEIKGIF